MTLDLSSVASIGVARHDATETIVGLGPATVIHDQDILNSESRVAAELGVQSWLAVGLVLPMRVFKTSIHYLDSSGNEVAIDNPFVHHHNETLVGPGDPWLVGRAAMVVRDVTLGARLGLALPLGRTEEDPFALGAMGLPHEHSQFGTGTVDPVVGLDVARAFGSLRADAFALTVQSLYANGHGYQAGDRYAAGLGAASAFGTARWRFRAAAEVQHETAERWNGTVHADEGNTGRTDVLAGLEVTFRATDDWHVGASLKAPIYSHVQGGQLDVPAFFGVSVGTHFHLFEGAEEHHHHGDEQAPPADWTGLDKQDVTNDGSAVPLVPVKGKITVFDFWASWCQPCGIVDHELAELARRHPHDLAVRKVNVVDADSPASKRYLGEATIPHLKVFDRTGKLLWERSAAPLALTGEVDKLLAAPRKRVAVVAAKRIAIEVTDAGYVPAQIEVPRDVPVTLVFTRTSNKTCATDVHFALPDGSRVDEQLPLGTAVEIPLRVAKSGTIVYACGMDMNRGSIVVK